MLKIVYAPDPILKEVCEPLSQVDDHHRDLIKKMFEAMYESNGVGLAAPQVGINKRIFLTEDGKVDLITDSTLKKNFLILAVKTKYKKLIKPSNEFEQYEAKARLNLVNKIYKTFDNQLNQKYKVELNQKTIDRVKNSF